MTFARVNKCSFVEKADNWRWNWLLRSRYIGSYTQQQGDFSVYLFQVAWIWLLRWWFYGNMALNTTWLGYSICFVRRNRKW